jgi:hypothetical protein
LLSRDLRHDLLRTVAIQCSVGANKVFDCIAPITFACGPVQQGRGRSRNAHGRSRLGDRSRAEHPEGVGEKASRVKLLVREDHLEHRAIQCRIQQSDCRTRKANASRYRNEGGTSVKQLTLETGDASVDSPLPRPPRSLLWSDELTVIVTAEMLRVLTFTKAVDIEPNCIAMEEVPARQSDMPLVG